MICPSRILLFLFFFFNDTATTEIYTLSLHDALPIYGGDALGARSLRCRAQRRPLGPQGLDLRVRHGRLEAGVARPDRKSTRLNSSHSQISYAVFCLKKKKQKLDTSIE